MKQNDVGWFYSFDENGQPVGKCEWYGSMPFIPRDGPPRRYVVFRRNGKWLLYDVRGYYGSANPRDAIARSWIAGDDGMMFPTLSAAKVFLTLRGKVQ